MRCIRTASLTLALLASAAFLPAFASAATENATTQLPRTVRPTHYDIALTPNARALTFAGKVSITLEVLQSTPAITLNAFELTFQSARLTDASNTKYTAPKIQVNDADQTATFTFDKSLAPGSYKLAIEYRGKIGTQANGLFAIDYDTVAGGKRALYTQFENSDARRVIPSWDEPAYKATFTLEATVPAAEMAISNMPIAQRSALPDGRSLVRFAQSPKMSTYLLFFGLGEFDRATARAGATEVGVVTQKGSAPQGAFVLQSAQAILSEYNNYFAIPYPLPKLDNIASPGGSQFFSAMENWGAIYTFESSILLNPAISTQADKQRAFSVAAHEMAHQWFGDLVTMSWWDDLWLNEGFATWMAGRTTTLMHPEWNTALAAVPERDGAMIRDSLATTHPVVQHVQTVEQASQAFDSITYEKGAAVIRMLEGYVGADAWRAGVRQYLKNHAYANTVSDDLWREIETAAKKPVLDIAHDFTLLPGVPMITVGEPTCVDGKTTLQLTQGEFTRDQPTKKPLRWRVPVIVQSQGNAAQRTVVADGKAAITTLGCGLVIVNAGQSGYYRTLYTPRHFDTIKASFAALAAIDQLGLLTDSWSLGLNGQQPTSDVLDLAAATPVQADPQLWGTIAGVFDSINDLYTDTGARQEAFRKFAIAKLTPVLARVGWNAQPGELDTIAILRSELIRTLSALDDHVVIAEARRRYAASKTDAAAIPAALRKTILGVVARHADAATWDQLHAAALQEKTPLIKDNLYSLLSSTQDESLARRALDLSLTAEPGATNSAQMISVVAALHPDLAFDFAIAHMDAVNSKVDVTSRSGYYPSLAAGSLDAAMIRKVNSYAEANLAESSRRDAQTEVARIAYRIKVRNERLPEIDTWLAGK
ncbi:MAG TPA: M1 family metallopeptidase [Steroidobacteraceae bacterium]|jgi:aminopeptidase N